VPERPIAGRVVAITGAARGIGRATAGALVHAGARVAIGDLDAELAERTATELGCIAHAVDVTDPASFERFLDWVEAEVGPLDVLVNNAGILHLGPFLEEDEAATRRQVDVNLLGVIHGTRLGVRRLRERGGGHLVNVASSAGKVTPPGIATYTATKHAVVGLTEAVRLEQRGSGIDFSIVMPGVVRTEMIAGYARSRVVSEIEPEDVAEAIVGALRRPRVDVFVPRSLGRINRLMQLLPRRAREWVGRAVGVDRITWDADRSVRGAYESRAAASDPGVPPAA
jgi:NAD(P)-dependent dehydrogenase (short-subunit alcohol dehydrogenase family)